MLIFQYFSIGTKRKELASSRLPACDTSAQSRKHMLNTGTQTSKAPTPSVTSVLYLICDTDVPEHERMSRNTIWLTENRVDSIKVQLNVENSAIVTQTAQIRPQ